MTWHECKRCGDPVGYRGGVLIHLEDETIFCQAYGMAHGYRAAW